MNLEIVLHVLGRLCSLLAWLPLAPLALCVVRGGVGSPEGVALVITAGLALGIGWALRFSFEWDPALFGPGEAFASFSLGWVAFAAIGALPFLLTGAIPGVLDAGFEALSGFTTTGATLLADPSQLSRPLMLWRAMTAWTGGLGFVAVSVAVLPALGAGGNFLYGADLPGPGGERLLPRLSATARLLWTLYLGFTGVVFVGLALAGMPAFEALCQSLALVSTGGFAARAGGLSGSTPGVQWVATAAMLVAGLNGAVALALARGRSRAAARNSEVRLYAASFLALAAAFAWLSTGLTQPGAVRAAMLGAASVVSTTGLPQPALASAPQLLHLLVLVFAAVGACSGSPGGGYKIARLALLAKATFREVARLLRPAAVFVLKVDDKPIEERTVISAGAVLVLAMISTAIASFALMFMGLDMASAFSSAVSAAANLGGGAHAPGATVAWADMPALGKLVVMALMLLGRLEFFSVLVLFSNIAWRR